MKVTRGSIVGALIICAPSSTQSRTKERDPEMHQTNKRNRWYCSVKAHVGMDSQMRVVYSVAATTAAWDNPVLLQFSSFRKAVARPEAHFPEQEVGFVDFPGTPFAGPHHYAVFMRGTTPLTARLIAPILINADTSAFAESREMPWYVTALSLSQPLHFGDYGGLPLKAIWAVLDFITIVVLVSGLYLWWTKRRLSVEGALGSDILSPPSMEQA
jgi:uncharacterized iron-regulated membrane protein